MIIWVTTAAVMVLSSVFHAPVYRCDGQVYAPEDRCYGTSPAVNERCIQVRDLRVCDGVRR